LAPEHVKLPLDWKKLDTTPFKKLLVLRVLRPDRISIALSEFISKILPNGKDFFDIGGTFADILDSAIGDAQAKNPIFFILSPGSDPVKEVEKIGKKQGNHH